MGWEQRSGRFYFYEKRRVGSRVISTYMGGSALALLAEEMIAERKQERDQYRKAQEKIRHEQKQIEQQIAGAESTLAEIVRTTLRAAGYHQHKGQWRKKRGGDQSSKYKRRFNHRKVGRGVFAKAGWAEGRQPGGPCPLATPDCFHA
jgi:ATPase subunit of ABC transporter with duplicated ATPase domains